jgi:hypothetical protein
MPNCCRVFIQNLESRKFFTVCWRIAQLGNFVACFGAISPVLLGFASSFGGFSPFLGVYFWSRGFKISWCISLNCWTWSCRVATSNNLQISHFNTYSEGSFKVAHRWTHSVLSRRIDHRTLTLFCFRSIEKNRLQNFDHVLWYLNLENWWVFPIFCRIWVHHVYKNSRMLIKWFTWKQE